VGDEAPGDEVVDVQELLEGDEPVVSRAVDLMKGGGGRIASDGLGPSLAFYVGYKAVGLGLGVAMAVVVAVAAYVRARRQGRRGLLPWITLSGVVIQGTIGLLADDARGFFAPQLVTGAIWGVAFVGSVAIGRPLVGVFARELFPIPEDIRASDGFRRLTGTLSLVFGVSILLRGVLRYYQLRNGSIDGYLLVSLLTGPPITILTIVWGLWFSRRALARLDHSRGVLPA
jgi:intracellular septation protein A